MDISGNILGDCCDISVFENVFRVRSSGFRGGCKLSRRCFLQKTGFFGHLQGVENTSRSHDFLKYLTYRVGATLPCELGGDHFWGVKVKQLDFSFV